MIRLIAMNIDAGSGAATFERLEFPPIFGPVDYAVRKCAKTDALVFGKGLFAGSVLPGSNRLIFAGKSPVWGGFYLSTMGGAALVFDRLGIEFVSIEGKAKQPSVLLLRRKEGEVIVEMEPVEIDKIWQGENGEIGYYSLIREINIRYGNRFSEYRILATGPAAQKTNMGAIGSAPIKKGEVTPVDTWAGRGGLGSKMVRDHNIVGVIYGGDYDEPDNWRDRREIDAEFQTRYQQSMIGEDKQSTVKYRYDPVAETGGTFGVNYSTLKDWMFSFNYRSIYGTDDERLALHERLIKGHYLDQFNEETIAPKHFKHCGEPCPAVCKKMRDKYKKDYEPYQTLGPGVGVFDQRGAEMLCNYADAMGFDAIQIGGMVSWLMELLHEGLLTKEQLGVDTLPIFTDENFDAVEDSMHNARLGMQIIDAVVQGRLGLSEGMRIGGRRLKEELGIDAAEYAVYTAFGEDGCMVPNQYWTPGLYTPMPIMGKYFEYYKSDFVPPFELGQKSAKRMIRELYSDNGGFCRFHRNWVEEFLPTLIEKHFGVTIDFEQHHRELASMIQKGNQPVFWETERTVDMVGRYLHKVESDNPALQQWRERFAADKWKAAREYWEELRKGIESVLGTP